MIMQINREMFEAWLFSQPRERCFRFQHCDACVLSLFAREQLGKNIWTTYEGLFESKDDWWNHALMVPHPQWFLNLTNNWRGTDGHSFGEAQDAYLKLFPDTLTAKADNTCVEDGCNEPRYVGSFCHTHGVETTNPTAEKV